MTPDDPMSSDRLASSGTPVTSPPKPPQGTVAEFDSHTRSGWILRDDGSRVDFPGTAVSPSIRLLRVGQRVRYELQAPQEVAFVTILTPQ